MTSSSCEENEAQFALDLLRTTSKSDENSFMSPTSVAICLAMVYVGADGKTKRQMRKTLFDGLSDVTILEMYGELVESLNKEEEGYELRSANRVYSQKTSDQFRLLDDYVSILLNVFHNEMQVVDFKQNADQIAKDINQWVGKQTNRRISNLVSSNSFDESTRLVLVNAIYFKGKWAKQFEVENTDKNPFYSALGKENNINLMCALDKFAYGETADCQVLSMPYQGDEALSMIIVLPKDRYGLPDFEKNLTGAKLMELIHQTRVQKVLVNVPKFRLEKQFSLSNALKSMGIKDLFEKEIICNLSKMTGKKDLYVSAFVHKAFVEISEEGTEAAAATIVHSSFETDSELCNEPPPEFRADHPFLFAIADKERLLFIGRYTGYSH